MKRRNFETARKRAIKYVASGQKKSPSTYQHRLTRSKKYLAAANLRRA